MKRYLQHVRRSRERLAPVVETMSEKGHSLMVRGTIGKPMLSSLRCDRHEEHESVPFYCGHPGSLDASAATSILDATLRKSISFSFTHFFKEFLPNSRSPDYLSELKGYACENGLLLALISGKNEMMGSFAHLSRLSNGRGRSVYEAFLVGNEVVPTFADLNISILMMRNHLDSNPSTMLLSMRDSEIRDLASKVREGSKSMEGFADQPEFYTVGKQNLQKATEPPPAFAEELKGHIWYLASSESPLQNDVELFLLCVEIEIAMMEKLLSELEKKTPVKSSRKRLL